jgi:hypothetical protein
MCGQLEPDELAVAAVGDTPGGGHRIEQQHAATTFSIVIDDLDVWPAGLVVANLNPDAPLARLDSETDLTAAVHHSIGDELAGQQGGHGGTVGSHSGVPAATGDDPPGTARGHCWCQRVDDHPAGADHAVLISANGSHCVVSSIGDVHER